MNSRVMVMNPLWGWTESIKGLHMGRNCVILEVKIPSKLNTDPSELVVDR